MLILKVLAAALMPLLGYLLGKHTPQDAAKKAKPAPRKKVLPRRRRRR